MKEQRYWTKSEEKFMADNIKLMTPKEMAKTLKRSVGSIHWKAFQLGLKFTNRKNKLYTIKEKMFFARNYGVLTKQEICEELHIGHYQYCNLATRLRNQHLN